MAETVINAFGVPVKKAWRKPYKDDIKKTHIFKYGVKLQKETGTTKPYISEEIDTDELIQSYKDQCGMEAALKLIRSGRLDPADLADDGKHGQDLTAAPEYAGDLLRQKQLAEAAAAKVKKELGIESIDGDIETIVNQAVEKKIAAIMAKAETPKEEDK